MTSISPLLHNTIPPIKLEPFEPTFTEAYTRSESPFSTMSSSSTTSSKPKRKYTPRQPLAAPSSSKRVKYERSDSVSSSSDTGSCDSSMSLVELKRERRKQQNRAASANSRMKKKAYIDEMEGKIAVLVSQQQALIASMNALRAENEQLKQQAGLVYQQQPVQRCVSGSSLSEWESETNEHVSEEHVSSPISCPSSPSTPLASMSPLSHLSDSSFDVSPLDSQAVDSLHVFDSDSDLASLFSCSKSDAIYESAALGSPQWNASLLNKETSNKFNLRTMRWTSQSLLCHRFLVQQTAQNKSTLSLSNGSCIEMLHESLSILYRYQTNNDLSLPMHTGIDTINVYKYVDIDNFRSV